MTWEDVFNNRNNTNMMDTRVKPEYDKDKISSLNTYPLPSLGIEQENTTLLSSLGIEQEKTLSLSVGEGNTTLLSSSGIGQERNLSFSIEQEKTLSLSVGGGNTTLLSSSDLIRRSINNEGDISSNNLSKKQKHDAHSAILPHKNNHNPNNLPQRKGYNITLNNPSQAKRHNTNPTNSPKQKGYNMTQNKLPQHKGYNMTQTNFSQSGRSMVEMLGVLAIIGVLSVGGIMGYTYGMDKYRTNETINEINLRLTTLQTQTLSGSELNLNEFTPSTGLGYTVGENYGWAEDDTKIYIGFSGIPEQVCEMVYEAMITEVDRIDVTTSQESTSLCGKDNEMKFYIDSGVEAICEPPCGAGEHCVDGVTCVAEGKTIAPLCSETKPCEGECIECFSQRCQPTRLNATPCNEGAGMCMNGICVPNPEEEEAVCSTNEQCPVGTYCATKRASVCDESKLQAYGCAPLDFVHQTITLNNGKQETWYASRQVMDYWNAKRACEAMGKRMPTYAELLQEGRAAKIERALSRYLGWVWTQTSCNDTCLSRKAYSWQGWGCHGVSNASVFYALCR